MIRTLLGGPLLLQAGEGARALEAEHHTQQILAVRRLPDQLTPGDQATLLAVLDQPVQGTESEVQEHNSLRNEIAVYLIRTRQQLPGLAASCREAWNREEENPVWLDYTLQFAGSGFAVYSPEDRKRMEALLWETTTSLEENYAGTALLALHRNVGRLEHHDQWIPTLRRVLRNEQQVPANRTTALQLLAETKDPEAAQYARNWLQPGADTTVPQQLTALNTLSILGTEEDIALFHSFERHPNRLLRKRAHVARTRFDPHPDPE